MDYKTQLNVYIRKINSTKKTIINSNLDMEYKNYKNCLSKM